MTVKELIAKLQELDQNEEVYYYDIESGIEKLEKVEKTTVAKYTTRTDIANEDDLKEKECREVILLS